ncbi:MAG: crossover junction endodeoxyribonuclease RuvC [Candidatus Moranbacteria bacterium]|nr:crossover junction endodeoxyribonuclease RuvC [Candidatus Moranbacteria bacterium]
MKYKNNPKILGIDPGTATTGWGIVQEIENQSQVIAYGCIETTKMDADNLRLKEVADDIRNIIEKHKPDEVAVEGLYFFKNLKTAIKVAQSRGVLLLVPTEMKLPVFEYTPLQIKQALTGYGRADKKQIQYMVQNILKLKKIPKPDDAADALAVALCHHQSRKINLLEQ